MAKKGTPGMKKKPCTHLLFYCDVKKERKKPYKNIHAQVKLKMTKQYMLYG